MMGKVIDRVRSRQQAVIEARLRGMRQDYAFGPVLPPGWWIPVDKSTARIEVEESVGPLRGALKRLFNWP